MGEAFRFVMVCILHESHIKDTSYKETNMRLRSLLLIGGVLALLVGLALLLGPATVLKFFGLPGTPAEQLLGQLIGAGMIGIAVMSWFASNETGGLNGTVLAMLVTAVIAFIVSLLAVLSKTVARSGNAWIPVILFLLFALGLAYFQFIGPRE